MKGNFQYTILGLAFVMQYVSPLGRSPQCLLGEAKQPERILKNLSCCSNERRLEVRASNNFFLQVKLMVRGDM